MKTLDAWKHDAHEPGAECKVTGCERPAESLAGRCERCEDAKHGTVRR